MHICVTGYSYCDVKFRMLPGQGSGPAAALLGPQAQPRLQAHNTKHYKLWAPLPPSHRITSHHIT
jgi:hypothetical protein